VQKRSHCGDEANRWARRFDCLTVVEFRGFGAGRTVGARANSRLAGRATHRCVRRLGRAFSSQDAGRPLCSLAVGVAGGPVIRI
jgi:hypothetical protein